MQSRKPVPATVRVVFALIMREMATSYGRSSLGYLWALLEPVGAVAILSLAFAIAFSSPALGESFPLFYATGYIPFMLYNTMQNKVSSTIRENQQLLFYPAVTYVDALASRAILTMITQVAVALIVFGGIVILDAFHQKIDFVRVGLSLLVAGFLGLGIGVLNCVIIHLSPAWRQIWSIITRPIFLVSCIFYLFDTLPEWVQSILWFNPLVHVIGMTRQGFYSTYDADYVVVAFPLAVGAVTLFFGLALLRRYSQDLINT
jgi:capsular polysaccharide transport system permease protein